jgi:UDP-sugar pyrophosphorylase
MQANMEIEDPIVEEYNGHIVDLWPRVVWLPSWALTFKDVCNNIVGPSLRNGFISQHSTLLIFSDHLILENIHLDGTLILISIPEAHVRLTFLLSFFQLIDNPCVSYSKNTFVY